MTDFSSKADDYEEWERNAGLTINQTTYRNLLYGPESVGNVIKEVRSKELYNMILSCGACGHALNTIKKVCNDNNGVEFKYKACKSFKNWYIDLTQVDSMISHWESKCDATSLDQDTSATYYINNFEMYAQKLENLTENWTDKEKFR